MNLGPTIDLADSRIPQPSQYPPARGVAGASRGSRPMIHVAVDDGFTDRLGLDARVGT
ncbi:MAG: hypothetical protein WBE90_15550 [Xanthobacteraceae bacterium]